MILSETRSVSVSLAVKLDDISTGHPVWPTDDSLRVVSGDGFYRPLAKNDGYFVFTGTYPDSIRVVSKLYNGFLLPLHDDTVKLLRVSMIPRRVTSACFTLSLAAEECAHVGLFGTKRGYALTDEITESVEISLHKADYADLTNLFHVVITKNGQVYPVFVKDALGYGRYRLLHPLSCPARGTRLLPLRRVVGCEAGVLKIPVPDGCDTAYILRCNELTAVPVSPERS